MHAGKQSTKRSIHGVLLLDKPQGPSSNQALQTVKRLFSAKKAGHTGSLDPLATGLLPICFGEATKFSQFLLEADKHYWVQIRLGVSTQTGDREGEVISQRSIPILSRQEIQTVLSRFLGDIAQVPPMFSALKHQGKPLYYWVRQGIEIARPARNVCIKELLLLDHTADTLILEIKCSKGTYIRSLAGEIGDALGCGGHVEALRRLGVGIYQAKQMVCIEQIKELSPEQQLDLLLPIDTTLADWPILYLTEAAAFYLRHGQAINLPGLPQARWVKLVIKSSKQFIGVGEILADQRVAPYRLISTS